MKAGEQADSLKTRATNRLTSRMGLSASLRESARDRLRDLSAPKVRRRQPSENFGAAVLAPTRARTRACGKVWK